MIIHLHRYLLGDLHQQRRVFDEILRKLIQVNIPNSFQHKLHTYSD